MRRILLLLFLGIVAAGCALPGRRACVPPTVAAARMHSLEGSEFSFPTSDPDLLASLKHTIDRDQAGKTVPNRNPQNYLALSGGGVYGAFVVGVLNGWTASCRRPQFDVVTGISTGALIATYAFLGPQYDHQLREYYSTMCAKDVYRGRRKLSLLWSDSAVDNEPFRQRIESAVTDELLAEVAAAHAQGRRLYIGTTNLDTRRLVIWDMGAIASSGRPDAKKLYRDVVLASASVPAFFPPVTIDVEIDGKKYQELHVDGGVTAAVFFQPFMLNLDGNDMRSRAGSNLYVMDAGKLYADPKCVDRRLVPIAATSLRAMLYSGTRNDLARLYTLALITGVNYHLMAVPKDYPLNLDSFDFNPQEMRRLYEEGYRQGESGAGWQTQIEIGVDEDITPRTGNRLISVR